MAKKKKDDHKKLIRKKRHEDLPCGLCKQFWDSCNRDKSGQTRYCKKEKCDVGFYSESCNDFELNNLFFCEPHYFQCSPDICISRITLGNQYGAKIDHCSSCVIGWKIVLYTQPPKLKITFKGE